MANGYKPVTEFSYAVRCSKKSPGSNDREFVEMNEEEQMVLEL